MSNDVSRDAGRELDAVVAEKVMGLVCGADFGECPLHNWQETDDEYNTVMCERCWTCESWLSIAAVRTQRPGPCDRAPRRYSTDIAAAWEVVEKLRKMVAASRVGSLIIKPYSSPQVSGDEWVVMHGYDGYNGRHDMLWWVSAKTAPLAICLAALKAVGAALQQNGGEL